MLAGCSAVRWPLALVLLLAAGVAVAEEVRICVITIIATERDKKIDPKLKRVAEEVQKDYPELTGFQFKNMGCKSVTVGGKEEFKLIEDEVATVRVKQAADSDNKVELCIKPPRMKEITYRTACGKFLPIMTPVRTKEGDVLIIGVCLRPCRGGK